jgi:hypothetical protein
MVTPKEGLPVRFQKWHIVLLMVAAGRAQVPGSDFHPVIPRTWDDEQIASLEVPLANPSGSAKHVSADYYYRIPVRTIYRQYPVYPPEHGPEGYISWLRQQEPEIVWGEDKNGKRHAPPLETEADGIEAGEIVFDSVLGSFPLPDKDLETLGELTSKRGIPLAKDGVLPFLAFRIIQKGRIEIGGDSCSSCHTRLMPDGTLLKGAQGNIPFDWIFAEDFHAGFRGPIESARSFERSPLRRPLSTTRPAGPPAGNVDRGVGLDSRSNSSRCRGGYKALLAHGRLDHAVSPGPQSPN